MCDINGFVLKAGAKYSDVCITRLTPSNSSVFWSVVLSSLMMVAGATETCCYIG